ncbi:MAG TPA: response regulator transcription factor [candidate division Zixibacteria bacterium]|nr:response regulator transcription factor [candidate division Zixibacteria bacterium]
MTEPVRPIRVAVVDDHPVVRTGTAAIVEQTQDLTLIGTAASLEEAMPLFDASAVDVLLLDLRLGQEFGLSALSDRGRAIPAIVVVTSYDYPQYVEAALRLGAAGYVLKTAPIGELLEAIRRAAAGKLAFDVRPGAAAAAPLSARERDVVAAVVDGLSNDEIAGRLGISPKTVESHLRRLFERHGLASRTELATRALRDGWLEVPPSG